MDITQEFPGNEREDGIQNEAVAAFGLTFQGASHKQSDPPVPCQDSHAIRWMEEEELFLAAIADGVGSCKLSHWGAYTAVNAALDSASRDLRALSGGRKLTLEAESPDFRAQMKEILVTAFRAAQDGVEALADSAQPPQPVFAFQSTLTLAIYDGKCLYHGHAGDDGIVAQLPDGTVEMATRRMKGEEASSVYPLQSGEANWSFGLVPEVAGFVMATDGVLDAFVRSHPDYFGINYFNGICYAFMEDAMTLLGQGTPEAAREAVSRYRELLCSPEYTAQVTDDLTLVAVVSPRRMTGGVKPSFSLDRWNTITRESVAAKRRALNHLAPEEPRETPLHEDFFTSPEIDELHEPSPEEPSPEPVPPPASPAPRKRILLWGLLVTLLLAATLLLGIGVGKLLVARQEKGQDAPGTQCTQQTPEHSAPEETNNGETADQGGK